MTRRIIAKLFGAGFALGIVFLLLCFAKFLFFHSQPPIGRKTMPPANFSQSIENPRESGHYHILPAAAYSDAQRVSPCLQCHGNFCHRKSEKLRSFYNMHSFYLACETCHVRGAPGQAVSFQWYDDTTDKKLPRVTGSLGNYGARIVALTGGRRLDIFPKPQLAQDYMLNEQSYSDEKKKRLQKELMAHLSQEAVQCGDCHRQNGYMPFAGLGYGKRRVAELTGLEIVRMLEEYGGKFYLPEMFKPKR